MTVVPDYQGVFLRGYGSQTYSQINGSLNGYTPTTYSSGSLNSIQGDAIRNITGNIYSDFNGSGGAINTVAYCNVAGWYVGGGGEGYGLVNIDVSRVVPTAFENRPVNKAVHYLIKAK